MQNVNLEQEVIALSKEKWRWMSERNVETLDALSTGSLSLSTWTAPDTAYIRRW